MQTDNSSTQATIHHVAPHELTKAEFLREASAVRLVNHGRKWQVNLGNHSAFSQADTAEAALADVHQSAVNNALYLNQADAPAVPYKPSIPTQNVLADYPSLVAFFGDVVATHRVEKLSVSKAEYDAVIAGLRMLAAGVGTGAVSADDGDIGEILTNGGAHSGLSAEEIHDLCDRLLTPTE